MKRVFLGIILIVSSICLSGQTISPELVSLGNFIKRMYEASAFEGVRIVEDYNKSYLISLVMLEKARYNNEIVMNKVANAKARSNVSKFLNGTDISTDFIVKTEERKTDTIRTEVITYDIVREKSFGMVDAMETLTSFTTNDERYYVYVLFREFKDLVKK